MTERWPRLMRRKVAAQYCDLSEAEFEREVLTGRLPGSRVVGRHEHWDVKALDQAIDALMGSGEPDWRQGMRKKLDEAA